MDLPHVSASRTQHYFAIGLDSYDETGVYNIVINGSGNDSYVSIHQIYTAFPVIYRVIATVVHLLLFVLGVAGNAVLIYVILRTRSLQTPSYRYLVSLAFADLLVLLSAVPEAIVFHHVGKRWTADQAACSLFIFVNFLGINAGSISILAFTVEIYIAICRPLVAQQYCTIPRTNKIVSGIWIFAILYCSPWLGLTEVKPDLAFEDRQQCDFRLSKEQYFYYFAADLLIFYVMPLVVALIIYARIVAVLYKSVKTYRENYRLRPMGPRPVAEAEQHSTATSLLAFTESAANEKLQKFQSVQERMQSRAHILRMLIAIVMIFAVCWLPYRGLLVYNTFLEKQWLNLWYMFFAKTMIYFNSAMNPFLYSAMSRRFRRALYHTLMCRKYESRTEPSGTQVVSRKTKVDDSPDDIHHLPAPSGLDKGSAGNGDLSQPDTSPRKVRLAEELPGTVV